MARKEGNTEAITKKKNQRDSMHRSIEESLPYCEKERNRIKMSFEEVMVV